MSVQLGCIEKNDEIAANDYEGFGLAKRPSGSILGGNAARKSSRGARAVLLDCVVALSRYSYVAA